MLLGAHMSIAGGVHEAVARAEAYRMTALQIFTRSARAWRGPRLREEEATRFREALEASRVQAVVAHAGYLSNIASPERNLRRRSERALLDELQRCECLGVPWLILHAGSHRDTTMAAGIRRVSSSLGRLLARTSGYRTGLLVENAAGQGCAVGARLEELAQVLGRAGDHPRLGVCIDTCHAFAAGYDLRGAGDWHAFREAVARTVGLERVHAVHVNDSLHPLGSRRDRHAAIGEGHIGRRGFRHLLADPALGRRPLILETPKEGPDGEDMDRRNLATLRRLARRARAGVTGR